jgi:hypothetical protein
VARRMIEYGGVSYSNKTGAHLPTFLNVQIFPFEIIFKSTLVLA